VNDSTVSRAYFDVYTMLGAASPKSTFRNAGIRVVSILGCHAYRLDISFRGELIENILVNWNELVE
jgi:hypothetical protein